MKDEEAEKTPPPQPPPKPPPHPQPSKGPLGTRERGARQLPAPLSTFRGGVGGGGCFLLRSDGTPLPGWIPWLASSCLLGGATLSLQCWNKPGRWGSGLLSLHRLTNDPQKPNVLILRLFQASGLRLSTPRCAATTR